MAQDRRRLIGQLILSGRMGAAPTPSHPAARSGRFHHHCQERVVTQNADRIDGAPFAEERYCSCVGRFADALIPQQLDVEVIHSGLVLRRAGWTAAIGNRGDDVGAEPSRLGERRMDVPFVAMAPVPRRDQNQELAQPWL